MKVLKSRPALHWDTVGVSTGELVLPAAGESECDLVRGVRRAGARVVVHSDVPRSPEAALAAFVATTSW